MLGCIFEPFTQVHDGEVRSQEGLGLALVKNLVELHGGSITAHSAGPGKGSEFVVRLKDEQGKPAVRESDRRPMPDAELRIVWTSTHQFGWNYCVPELHGGKDLSHTDYPSANLFLEKKLGARALIEMSIPDTPYSFYVINGHVSPFFQDSEKNVIWELKNGDLEKAFGQMRSISATSKRIVFCAPGGDMATLLIVDFIDRKSSPKVQYYVRIDGY
jgi:hypothetical protein